MRTDFSPELPDNSPLCESVCSADVIHIGCYIESARPRLAGFFGAVAEFLDFSKLPDFQAKGASSKFLQTVRKLCGGQLGQRPEREGSAFRERLLDLGAMIPPFELGMAARRLARA